MFHEMRRKDRQINREEVIELLRQCDYGVLATISQNGKKYIANSGKETKVIKLNIENISGKARR